MLLCVVHASNPDFLNGPDNQIGIRLSRADAFEKSVIQGSIIKKPTERLLLLNFFKKIISVGLYYSLPQSNCQRCKLSDKPILLSKSKPERMLLPFGGKTRSLLDLLGTISLYQVDRLFLKFLKQSPR